MNFKRPPLPLIVAGSLIVGAGVGYGVFASGALPSNPTGLHAATDASGDAAQPASDPDGTGGSAPVYTCPMHPQVISDKPGSCPICGMDLVKKQVAAAAESTANPTAMPEVQGTPVYTCPMHPQVVSDRPGSCPICGMDLVRKQATAETGTAAAPGKAGDELNPGASAVVLSPRQRVLANVETAAVTRATLSRTIETTGRVTVDETRLQRLSAWIDGRIDQLRINATGDTVAKGAVVATLYSPDLVAAQQEYLTALAGQRELARSPYPELAQNARTLAAAARQRLRLMGVAPGQLTRLEATGRPIMSFPILAPVSGVVMERKVQAGQYVKAGDVLFDLADFSRVWVEASVFEAELGSLRPGQRAEVRVTAFPEKTFAGRVSFIQPVLAAETRTATLRIELPNPGGALKPEMYANVRVSAPLGGKDQLAVPASAVIATGRRHVVYVEDAPNRFAPRTVMLGAKAGDSYPVFSGLKEGELVAVSGGFLLDASSQLGGGAQDAHEGHAIPQSGNDR